MRRALTLKLLLGVVIIFLAGGLTGALVGTRMGKEAVEKRSKIENLNQNIMNLLTTRLSLTAQQVETVQPMVDHACEELEEIHREGAARVETVIRKYHELIAAELSGEQYAILKEMERQRRRDAGFED